MSLFFSRFHNFSKGKSIALERTKLEKMNENMKFKGGPDDKKYRTKVMDLCKGKSKFSAFREAFRKKVGMYIDMHRKK